MVSTGNSFSAESLVIAALKPANGYISENVDAPDYLECETLDVKKIQLTWDPVFAASGYEIFRRVIGENYEKIADINDASITEYIDKKDLSTK